MEGKTAEDPRVAELLAEWPGAKVLSSEEILTKDMNGQEKKTLNVTLETPDGLVTTYEYVDFNATAPASTRPDSLPLASVNRTAHGEQKTIKERATSKKAIGGSAPQKGTYPDIFPAQNQKEDNTTGHSKESSSEVCQSGASIVEEAIEIEHTEGTSAPGSDKAETRAGSFIQKPFPSSGQSVRTSDMGSVERREQYIIEGGNRNVLQNTWKRSSNASKAKSVPEAMKQTKRERHHSASSESSAASMGAHERGVGVLKKPGKASHKTGKTTEKHWLQNERKDDQKEIRQTLLESSETVTLSTYASCSMVLPHVRRVTALRPGRSIAVEGVVNKPAREFSVSLQTGLRTGPGTQVALLFNPIVEEKKIVCNSYLYDNWGAAQTETKKVPFIEGRKFAIRIAVEQYNYQIFINDVHLMDFEHRISYEKVTHIRLDGDAYFLFCEYPYELDLPYVLEEASGLRSGQHIVLDAFVWRKALSFEINLQCGEKYPEVNASLVFRASFPHRDKPKLDISSFYNETFGEDMAVGGDIPLLAGTDLKLTLVVENDIFRVMVGTTTIAEYPHSLPVKKLTHVLVDGDLSLYGLKITRPRRKGSVHRAAKKWKHSCCVVL